MKKIKVILRLRIITKIGFSQWINYTDEKIRNVQMNYILQSEAIGNIDYDMLINNYTLNSLTQTDYNLKVVDFYLKYDEEIVNGEESGTVAFSNEEIYTFLGLLSNDEGEYKLGEKFKPKSSGGKLVSYKDVYGFNSPVGPKLEFEEEWLGELLGPQNESLMTMMQYALYLYKTSNYIVETKKWEFKIFNWEETITIKI